MKSMPCSRPKMMSERSLSETKGMLSLMPGTLIDLRLDSGPALSALQTMSVPSLTSCTSKAIRPSSMRMRVPGFTSFGRPS